MDIENTIYKACSEMDEVTIHFNDGRESVTGDVSLRERLGDFQITKGDQEVLATCNYEDIQSVVVLAFPDGYPEPLRSEDGEPFYNGYCWQESGDEPKEFGICHNPECVDPHADLDERKSHGLPTGKYWGSSIKTGTCTCGGRLSLT